MSEITDQENRLNRTFEAEEFQTETLEKLDEHADHNKSAISRGYPLGLNDKCRYHHAACENEKGWKGLLVDSIDVLQGLPIIFSLAHDGVSFPSTADVSRHLVDAWKSRKTWLCTLWRISHPKRQKNIWDMTSGRLVSALPTKDSSQLM